MVMGMEYFTVININASRCRSLAKIREIHEFISSYEPNVVAIQEIYISSALKEF